MPPRVKLSAIVDAPDMLLQTKAWHQASGLPCSSVDANIRRPL